MGLADLIALCQQALLLAGAVSLPIVGALALVGLLVALLQAALQIQDQSVGQLMRLLTTLGVLLVAGSWMGSEVLHFAIKTFGGS
ncbi:MAG TPA: flagellar biosynthetic protein FliQ [Polyangiaceae bacterium]|nr:flagellar biosynthetic protein FliQ [Polyangiaceae bacterium]